MSDILVDFTIKIIDLTIIKDCPILYEIKTDYSTMAHITVLNTDYLNNETISKIRNYTIKKFNAKYIELSELFIGLEFSCNTKDVFRILRESGII